jgi:hypothetical protein
MWHRGAEKTAALLNSLLIEAHQEKALYWYIGPYLNQATATVWTDPNTSIFRWIPEDYRKALRINQSDHSITLPNESIIQIKGADKPDSLRGPKPKRIKVDEYGEIARRWGSEFREAILEPSVRSSNGGIDYGGTPTGSNDFSYIASLATTDPNWWYSRKTVDDTGIYTPEQIAEIKKNSIHEAFFLQEYFCQIIEGANSVFKNVEQAVSGVLEPGRPGEQYIFGIDLARTLDSTVLVGFRRRDNHLVYYKKITNETWESQKAQIKQALWAYGNAEAVIDATGVGDSFVENLLVNDQLRLIPLKIKSNLIKRILVEKLAQFIENKYITYPFIQDLINELNNYEYKVTSQNNITYNAPSGKHDDIVMAMALAVNRMEPLIPKYDQYEQQFNPLDPRTGYPT